MLLRLLVVVLSVERADAFGHMVEPGSCDENEDKCTSYGDDCCADLTSTRDSEVQSCGEGYVPVQKSEFCMWPIEDLFGASHPGLASYSCYPEGCRNKPLPGTPDTEVDSSYMANCKSCGHRHDWAMSPPTLDFTFQTCLDDEGEYVVPFTLVGDVPSSTPTASPSTSTTMPLSQPSTMPSMFPSSQPTTMPSMLFPEPSSIFRRLQDGQEDKCAGKVKLNVTCAEMQALGQLRTDYATCNYLNGVLETMRCCS